METTNILNVAYASEFIEIGSNTIASDYIVQHYAELLERAKSGCRGGEDLLNDLYINMIKAEARGDGYNPGFGNTGVIGIEQFIYSRIRAYKKNPKYGALGASSCVRNTFETAEICASYDGEDLDTMTSYQKAYATYGVYDEYDLYDIGIIKSDIDYVLDFEEDVRIPLIGFLRHIDEFAEVRVDSSLFSALKNTMSYHSEFREAIMRLLKYKCKNPEQFNNLLEQY